MANVKMVWVEYYKRKK